MKRLVVAVGIVAVVAAGCRRPTDSGSVAPASGTPVSLTTIAAPAAAPASPDLKALAAQYLQIVAPANRAGDEWRRAYAQLDSSSNSKLADLDRISKPLIAADTASDEALLRVPWPTTIKGDINAMVTADKVADVDLSTVGSLTLLSMGAWEAQLAADVAKRSAAVSIVRADLGLPPAQEG